MSAMRLNLRVLTVVLLTAMSLVPVADALCDATCACANLQFGICLDPGVCGNKPCQGPTPNAECPQDPPASLTAKVIGDGQLAMYWADPLNIQLVDEFNVWYSTVEGATACSGLASGSLCSFTLPGEETPRSGTCGSYAGGTMYCWLDLFPKLLAVLPCVKPAPDDSTCNYQTLTSGVEIGRFALFTILSRLLNTCAKTFLHANTGTLVSAHTSYMCTRTRIVHVHTLRSIHTTIHT